MKKMANPCWKGYRALGLKMKNGKRVPNCVPVSEELGPDNSWGTPALTKKMLKMTPGSPMYKKMMTFGEHNKVEADTVVYHSHLNPAAWKGYEIVSSVKEKLLKIAEKFSQTWGIDIPIHDVILTGSNANYNWNKYSDFDLHVVVDITTMKIHEGYLKQLFRAKKDLFNKSHNISIKGYHVEVYIQTTEEHLAATGQYSLYHNHWVIQPQALPPKFHHDEIKTQADAIIKRANRALNIQNLEELEKILRDIADMRKSGLLQRGEFGLENLVFKVLRNSGIIEKIRNMITNVNDKHLSLESNAARL